MSFDIHSLVKDSHDIDDIVGDEPVKQHMGSAGELAVTSADLIARPTEPRILDRTLDGVLKFAQVDLRLVYPQCSAV